VVDLVDDAVANGATLHCGGPTRVDGLASETFYAPAVLTGVTPAMRIMREEIFGPVIPIVTVDSEEEAVRLANDSPFGLGASVWTGDREKGRRIARRLQAGMVWINDHMYSHGAMQTPWGGVKESGLGRAHSRYGFHECVNLKHIAYEPGLTKDFWWFPYDESLRTAMHNSAKLLYGRDADKAEALRRGALPLARVLRKTLER
jgi:succinate-semialdehyde dehydrogenase/glutarate-semialdehyde dehydrogenase